MQFSGMVSLSGLMTVHPGSYWCNLAAANTRERLKRASSDPEWSVNGRSDRSLKMRLVRRADFHLMSAPARGNVLMT
jgi:hypothetical protein